MSISTIVSLLPWSLTEEKPGQFPSVYRINRAPAKGEFGITVIGDAYFLEPVPFADEGTPPRRIDIISKRVADAVVLDYERAQLATNYEWEEGENFKAQALPGLFSLDGEHDHVSIQASSSKKVRQAVYNQTLWFSRLVKIADDDWNRYQRHNVISDMQRAACKWLGLDRPWNFDALQPNQMTKCPACLTIVSVEAAICYNCKVVLDVNKAKNFQFAK